MATILPVKRALLLALGAAVLFALSFAAGFLMPHPRLAGLGAALDFGRALSSVMPVLALVALTALLAEAALAWRGRRTGFRWTLLASGATVAGFGAQRGLLTSFSGV